MSVSVDSSVRPAGSSSTGFGSNDTNTGGTIGTTEFSYSLQSSSHMNNSTSANTTSGTKRLDAASTSGPSISSNSSRKVRRMFSQKASGLGGLAESPSPVVQHTGPLQYNGPHCISMEDDRLDITHGMHKDYTIRIGGHVKTVLFYPRMKSCIVLHAGGICRYNKDELVEEFHNEGVYGDIDKLLHSTELGVYIGVCKRKMKLLNRGFQLLHEAECPQRITAAVFNQHSGEVVTASPGRIMTWGFRQGAKVLAQSHVFTHGLLPEEEISVLHLEPVPGNAQRIFASIGCSMKAFMMVNGKPMEYLSDIHSRPISAILFFRPLRLLLTASKDGSIKVWDSSRRLCSAFVSHRGAVTALVPYPYGPMVISCSLDSTMRVWNLATFDQVQILDNIVPLEGVSCEPGIYSMLCHSSRLLKTWFIMQLYDQTTNLGIRATCLQRTSHPLVPLRVVAACADSAVRVVSPVSANVITTALLPVERTVVSACYIPLDESLYVLDDAGSVSRFYTLDNPSSVMGRWQCPQHMGKYSCLGVYEVAMDEEDLSDHLKADRWFRVTLEARLLSRQRMAEKDPLEALRTGESLLLAGTSEGYMVMLGQADGEVQFSMPSGQGEVKAIVSSPRRRHVVTAGKDPTLCVWEVSPHSGEKLSILTSFCLASPPSLLVATHDRLCVARNNHELASYTLDMFNITERETFSADPDHSHSDSITGLDVSHKLRMFASCSLDCTVRVWSEDNLPLRILHLDCAPDGLVFCSLQADIMVAIHSHLYTIANFTYFTEGLHKQLIGYQFLQMVSEVQLPWSEEFSLLPPHDRNRLLLVDDTISGDSYTGDLSPEEMARVEEAAREKESDISIIKNRERELRALSQGTVSSTKSKLLLTKKEKECTWQRFFAMLRPSDAGMKIVLPEDDLCDHTHVRLEVERPISPYTEGPLRQFFPPLATFDPPYPFAPDGYLPNSSVLSELRKSDADKLLAKGWKLPVLSDRQKELMAEMEEEEEEEEEVDSDLMNRLQAAMAVDVTSPVSTPTPVPTPEPSPLPPKRRIEPLKPIKKLVAPKPPVMKITPPRLKTPPRERTPSPPPPPPTPLPEYIAQFIGQYWFDTLFPKANSSTFPKPWSVTSFISILLQKLIHPLVGYDIKADICRVIQKLLKDYDATNQKDIYTAVMTLLAGPPVLSTTVPYEKATVMQALSLIFYLNKMDMQLAVLLMVHYIEGDEELRKTIMDYFVKHGLRDPHGYFNAAVLKIQKLPHQVTPTAELYSRCEEWAEFWNSEFHLHSYSKSLATKKPAKKSLKGAVGKTPQVAALGPKVSFGKVTSSRDMTVYNAIDVINYYVTVEHENALARARQVTPQPPTPEPEVEEAKRNSVISLPKISKHPMLTRLGETHCSCCHPERETAYHLIHHLPRDYNRPDPYDPTRLWRNFTHYLSMALIPQNVNPFLNDEEKETEREVAAEQHATRMSVAGMTKYFIHEKSYVRNHE